MATPVAPGVVELRDPAVEAYIRGKGIPFSYRERFRLSHIDVYIHGCDGRRVRRYASMLGGSEPPR